MAHTDTDSPGRPLDGGGAEIVFAGDSELGVQCREMDWAATPLGPVENWPQSLRTTAGMVVSASVPMMLAWGPELIQIYNDGYRAMIGEKHPRALGQRASECWAEIWDEIRPLFEQVRAGDTVHMEDMPLTVNRHGAPEEAFFTFSYNPVPDESGRVGGVLDVAFETTLRVAGRRSRAERERLFRELEVERARLEYVFRQAPSFLAVLRGPDHVFTLANDAYYRMVGDRDLLDKPVIDALPEVRDQGFLRLLDEVLETGEPFVGVEVPIQLARSRGEPPETRFVDFVYLPLEEADGSRSGVISHGTDVTESVHARQEIERLLGVSEKARQEAEEANQAKSQFLANMSHEIRTPINAIVGYADLLEIGIQGSLSQGQQAYVDRIKTSSKHLTGLVNEILDLSKIESGGTLIEQKPYPVAVAAEEAIGMVIPQARAKNIRIAEQPDCDPGAICLGDPDRVRQILVNLLSNAVKFTRPGGRVGVRCRVYDSAPDDTQIQGEGPWIGVEVEDTGIGVAPEQVAPIFDPFVQVDAAHTREQSGTGLGLTISRRLARMMGGDLTLVSELGAGSTFTLWLPAAAPGAAPATDVEDPSRWPSIPGEVPGLAEIGHLVVEHADALVRTFADRIASDADVPHARGLNRGQLEDHIAPFLAALGKSLISLDEGGGEPALMRDGSEIQRLISDLHGDQRSRLGWTTAEIRREVQILTEELDALLLREGSDPKANVDLAMGILHRLLARAERISVRGLADRQ